MSKRVADLLVETLQAAGVKTCYGIVGDTLNRIAHAIDRSEIDWVHMRHEEAGAFAAGAEAMLTGRLTACAGSCGPGSLHFINGLYEANRNRAPVILIATQIVATGTGLRIDPGDRLRRRVQGLQRLLRDDPHAGAGSAQDSRGLPGGPDETWRGRSGRAGRRRQCRFARGIAVYRSRDRTRSFGRSDADLDKIAAILNESEAITIYAGAGCAGAHDEVVATAARLNAPMAHTSRGKDFVEYDNPYNVGMTGMIGGAAGYHAILDCDVLLQLGADFAWGQFYPDKATIIQIDAEPTHIGRRHPVAIGAVGDIKTTLEALLPRLKQHDDSAFLLEVRRASSEGCSSGEGGNLSGSRRHDFGDLPDQVDQQACGRRRAVRGGRRDRDRLDAPSHRHRTGNAELLPACSRGRWRPEWGRRLDCKSANPAAR